MTEPPRRPWWRKKRCAAALLVWLLLVSLLDGGPALYGEQRGWLSPEWRFRAHRPAVVLADHLGLSDVILAYHGWWLDLADRHEAAAD